MGYLNRTFLRNVMQQSHVDMPKYIKGLCEAHIVSKCLSPNTCPNQ